jgi:hypothetical protein
MIKQISDSDSYDSMKKAEGITEMFKFRVFHVLPAKGSSGNKGSSGVGK